MASRGLYLHYFERLLQETPAILITASRLKEGRRLELKYKGKTALSSLVLGVTTVEPENLRECTFPDHLFRNQSFQESPTLQKEGDEEGGLDVFYSTAMLPGPFHTGQTFSISFSSTGALIRGGGKEQCISYDGYRTFEFHLIIPADNPRDFVLFRAEKEVGRGVSEMEVITPGIPIDLAPPPLIIQRNGSTDVTEDESESELVASTLMDCEGWDENETFRGQSGEAFLGPLPTASPPPPEAPLSLQEDAATGRGSQWGLTTPPVRRRPEAAPNPPTSASATTAHHQSPQLGIMEGYNSSAQLEDGLERVGGEKVWTKSGDPEATSPASAGAMDPCDLSQPRECQICYETLIMLTALHPCGHILMCKECVVKHVKGSEKKAYLPVCPFCTTPIETTLTLKW